MNRHLTRYEQRMARETGIVRIVGLVLLAAVTAVLWRVVFFRRGRAAQGDGPQGAVCRPGGVLPGGGPLRRHRGGRRGRQDRV